MTTRSVRDITLSYTAQAVREEWSKWIGSVFGSNVERGLEMVTFTFRTPRQSSSWTRPGTSFVTHAMQKLDIKLTALGMTWFGVVEEGSDTRRLHLHYLVQPKSDEDYKWLRIVRLWWERDFGFTQSSRVRSGQAVSVYVTKYVTKSTAIFSCGGAGWRIKG